MALTGKNTEEKIWNFLMYKDIIGNPYGVAGLMGNLYYESGLNPTNLQDSYQSKLGYTDSTYTNAVDSGRYTKFETDKAGYGLAQWTDPSRKKTFLKYLDSYPTIGDLEGQLRYLHWELSHVVSFQSKVLEVLKKATTVDEASNAVLFHFEKPKDQGSSVQFERATKGKEYYDRYAGGAKPDTSTKGYKLVEEARKHLGKPYEWAGNGPNSFDCSGFIKYVYNKAINYGMTARTAYTQQNLGKLVSTPMAGDLIFFTDTYDTGLTPNISHVGMFTGEGDGFIQASGDSVNEVSSLSANNYWKSKYYSTKRLLANNETYNTGGTNLSANYSSNSAIDTITGLAGGLPLSRVNEFSEELSDAIKTFNKSNNSYCSLIDLTYGGEFKFYLPESFTESLPISWEINSSVLGRSVPAVGYNNSGPRSIPLELDLVAGAGYYEGSNHENVMKKLYKDINFIKSLVYPDYSKAIVQPPSIVLLSLGSMVKLRGVVKDLDITYRKPIDSKNRAMMVTISFTVSQASDEPPGRSDIISGNIRSY